MNLGKGICVECGKERPFGKPSLKLCIYCNKKRLEKRKQIQGKEKQPKIQKMLDSGQIKRANKTKPPKRKNTGEKELFLQIWEERPHVSEISGKSLGNEPKAIYFFHILGKGAYPAYKLNPDNIILTTEQEHIDWHSMGKDDLIQKEPKFKKVFEKYETLKSRYCMETKKQW